MRHIDGQQVYDKMLSITNNQRKCRSKHKRYFIPAGKGSTKKCKKRRMLLRMWRKRSAYALLVGMHVHGKVLWRFLKKFERELLCDPLSHFWIYTQGNEIIVSKRDLYSNAHCSIIHSSLVIETTIFQQVNGLEQCDVTCTGKYYLAIRKRKKSFHFWQHGWNWRVLCQVN